MKKTKTYIFLSISFIIACLFSCNEQSKQNIEQPVSILKINYSDTVVKTEPEPIVFDTLKSGLVFNLKSSYPQSKLKLKSLKNKLHLKYNTIRDSLQKEFFLDSISYIYANNLINEIVPHWYGTPWDMAGYSAKPNVGEVGCSYFVSNTLKHSGLNVNRYRLAQQGPENEANTVAINNTNSFNFGYYDFNEYSEMFNKIPEGVYFIGLDSHVGYFYKKDEQSIFIHSNYIDDKVMAEVAETSLAFQSSIYYFSKITGNKDLMLSWLKNKEVKVFLDKDSN